MTSGLQINKMAKFLHRYLIEVDCSSGQFKSAKLKDKEYTINVTDGTDNSH